MIFKILALAALLLISVGCDEQAPPDHLALAIAPPATNTVAVEIPGVYDDKKNTVYIKSSPPTWVDLDQSQKVADLMVKKRVWEEKNPANRIVTMSVVTGNVGGHGHPYTAGLLIHYEQR